MEKNKKSKSQVEAVQGPFTIQLEKDQVLCKAGDKNTDLYIIHTGRLMVCVCKGTQVTPVAFLGPGEYLGELSFFDGMPRSATVISVEKSSLVVIPAQERDKQFPRWLLNTASSLTQKIRNADELIRLKGIRKQNVESIKPLTMEEQRHYGQVIQAAAK